MARRSPSWRFETLFATFCLPFLRVAMSKERAELEQRKAALTDALTGVANRRAFFDRGGPLLEWALAERRPAALLLFDLDRFKEVNDTAGHQAGDRVLKAFCDLVAASMRPGDLFGRLGGEEFACLVVDASMAQALHTAERLRREFEAMRFPGLEGNATVSVGVAMASESGRSCRRCWRSRTGRSTAPRRTGAIASRRRRWSWSIAAPARRRAGRWRERP